MLNKFYLLIEYLLSLLHATSLGQIGENRDVAPKDHLLACSDESVAQNLNVPNRRQSMMKT